MNKALPSQQFTALIEYVVEVARGGASLTEDLYDAVFNTLSDMGEGPSRETIALAVRELNFFCDWTEFDRANEFLQAGGTLDQVAIEIQRTRDERKASLEALRFDPAVTNIGEELNEIRKNQRHFMKTMRDVETLMGFDEEVLNQLYQSLGKWDEEAASMSLLDLLPEELTLPFRASQGSTPYDHRLHSLVHEFVSRLGSEALGENDVIRHCGHVLARHLHSDDQQAASDLLLEQAILLAEAYIKQDPWDILGLCWRGELACWAWDEELIEEYARRVWERTHRSSAKVINEVTSFFVLTTDYAGPWTCWGWDHLAPPPSHFGEIAATNLDVERPLALAVVRRAMQRGVWDTSSLSTTFQLRESGYIMEPDDLPVECWVWMAENFEHSRFDIEWYYECHNNAFRTVESGTDPRLSHNVSVVLLAARLFNRCGLYDVPSIHEILTGLTKTFRADSTAHKRQAALEMARYILDKINPDYLTAPDRLAMTKAIAELRQPLQSSDPSGQSAEVGDGSEQINPSLLGQAEVYLKSQIGEKHWARLSSVAKDQFRHGEFMYIMATKREGEGGNFDGFVFHYSKGLLAEVQLSLLAPIETDRSLKQEYYAIFGKTEPPEWTDLLRLIDDPGRLTRTRYGKRVLAQRVDLRGLTELRDFIVKMKSLRNRASHSGPRISRDEATLLHGLLVHSGMIQKIVELFPKPPKR